MRAAAGDRAGRLVARVSCRFIMNSSDRPIVASPDVSARPAWPSARVCAPTGAPWTLSCRWGGRHVGKAVAGSADLDPRLLPGPCRIWAIRAPVREGAKTNEREPARS